MGEERCDLFYSAVLRGIGEREDYKSRGMQAFQNLGQSAVHREGMRSRVRAD